MDVDLALLDDAEDGEDEVAYMQRSTVLRHLLRNKSIYDRVGSIAARIHFFNGYPLLSTLFKSFHGYCESYHGAAPSSETMLGCLMDAVDNGDIDEVDQKAGAELIMRWWKEDDWHLEEEFVLDIIKKARTSFINDQVLQRQEEQENIVDIVNDAKRELDVDPFARAMEANPFTSPNAYLQNVKFYPSGPEYLDEALNGGGQIGDVIGWLAPSGGGKTTQAVQVCADQVAAMQHVVYFPTEQGIEGDIALRCFVQATKRKREYWQHGWDKVPADVKAEFERVRPRWETYFHPIPLRDNMPKSIDEMFSYVRDIQDKVAKRNKKLKARTSKLIDKLYKTADTEHHKKILKKIEAKEDPWVNKQVRRIFLDGEEFEGEEVVYVLVDWWGDIRDALMEYLVGQKSETAARRAGRTWLKELKSQCAPNHCGVVCIIFHQLSGEAASKNPGKRQSSHSAQEDRNFNNRMDFCFTLSVMDSNQRAKLFSDKARRFAKKECLVELDGELCMFRKAGDPNHAANALTTEEDEESIDMDGDTDTSFVDEYTVPDNTNDEFD